MEQRNDQYLAASQARIKTLDIILPTYNNHEQLVRSLTALAEQTGGDCWKGRVIICDDGSDTGAVDVIQDIGWSSFWDKPLVLSLPHQGRAAARNAGIRASRADSILFLADDIVLRDAAILQHTIFHDQHPEPSAAALGWVMWDPAILPTPLMEWMTHGGQQNNFDGVLGLVMCDAESFFYGSHLSMKREFLEGSLFNELFLAYGWEDLELGSRLQGKGLCLYPLPQAVGLHVHRYDAVHILHRQRVIGAQKYRVNTKPVRWIVHELYRISGARTIFLFMMKKWGNRLNFPQLFHLITAGEFWYGVHHANRVLKREKYFFAK